MKKVLFITVFFILNLFAVIGQEFNEYQKEQDLWNKKGFISYLLPVDEGFYDYELTDDTVQNMTEFYIPVRFEFYNLVINDKTFISMYRNGNSVCFHEIYQMDKNTIKISYYEHSEHYTLYLKVGDKFKICLGTGGIIENESSRETVIYRYYLEGTVMESNFNFIKIKGEINSEKES